MANSRTDNVIKNSGASMIYRIIYLVIHFVMRTVFIRLLGKEYTGISSLFTDILSVLSLVEMGLDASMVFSLFQPLAAGDEKKIAGLMNFYRRAFTLIGVAVMACGLALLPVLQYIVKGVPNIREDIRLIFIMYVMTTASSYFFVYKTILIRADQKSRIISYTTAFFAVGEFLLEVLLLVITRQFFAYLIVRFVASVTRNFVLSRKAEQMYPQYLQNREAEISREDKISLYKNIAALCVYNLAAVVLSSTDSIFISAFVGTVEVAIVGNFTLIVHSIKNIIQLMVNASRPSVGNYVATDSTKRQLQLFFQINFLTFWVACFCSTCLFNLLNPFVGGIWFDKSYQIDTGIIALMVINFYISVMSFTTGTFRSANGLFVQGWYRPAVMTCMNVILDYFMGRSMGIIGIYLATLISLLLTQVWYDPYIVFKHAFKMKPWRYYRDYLIMALLTVFCCAAAYLLSGLVTISNKWLSFAVRMMISACLPNLVLYVLFRRTNEYVFVKTTAVKIVNKVINRKRKSAG